MTPEERVKRLKDFDRWTVNSVAPRRVVAKRRPQWIIPVIAGVATSVLAIAIVLGAVSLREYRALHPAVPTSTPTDLVTPTPTSTPSPTSPPTHTAAPFTNGPTRPEPSIDLDCSDLVSASDLSTFMGVSVEEHDPLESYIIGGWGAGNAATVAAGGLECEWSNGAPNNGNAGMQEGYAGMQASILPGGTALWEGDSLGYQWRESVGCIGNEGSACDVSKLVGSTIVEIHIAGIDRMGRTPKERLAGFMPILDRLESVILAAGDAPEIPEPVQTQWGGCDEFPSMQTLSDITGMTLKDGSGDGGGGWSVAGLAAQGLSFSSCITATDSDDYLISMSSTSDMGWFVTDYAGVPSPQGNAVQLRLDGLADGDSAWARCTAGDNVTVFTNNCIVDLVVDGSWLQARLFDADEVDFGRPDIDVLTDVAAAMLEHLR